jgi:hypothetical protein
MEDSLKRNKRDGNLRHMSVVYSTKAPAGLAIHGWIGTDGPPADSKSDVQLKVRLTTATSTPEQPFMNLTAGTWKYNPESGQ